MLDFVVEMGACQALKNAGLVGNPCGVRLGSGAISRILASVVKALGGGSGLLLCDVGFDAL